MANAKIVTSVQDLVNAIVAVGLVALYATRQEDVILVEEQVFVEDVMGRDGFGFVKFVNELELFA
jgi:hypothetical protein